MKRGKNQVIVVSSDDESRVVELDKMTRLEGGVIHPVFGDWHPEKTVFHAGIFDSSADRPSHRQKNCIATGRIALEGNRAIVKTVAVHEPLQRTGLGLIIVSALEEVARDRGIVDLRVFEPFPSAIGFFEKIGYGMVPGEIVSDMTKVLSDNPSQLHVVKLGLH